MVKAETFIGLLLAATGLIAGLIAAYVSLRSRGLLAEVRRELAELENRLIARIDGAYVRSTECLLREEATQTKIAAMVAEHERSCRQESGEGE